MSTRIEAMLAPSLDAMGFDIVRIQLSGGARPTLQVMAERRDGREMTVDDCAGISRAVSALLDVEDPIAGGYVLEVSSPGVDRPLTRARDYARFAGEQARIETAGPIDGRKRFQGLLIGVDENGAALIREGATEFAVPLAAIAKAKLVLTDDLLRRAAARRRAADQALEPTES